MSIIVPPGFLLINKPANVTSTECVTHIKRAVRTRNLKIGHTGTLDSFATGLLIIGIGRAATRHIDQIMTLDKQYRATGHLGVLTSTYDFTGTTIVQTTPPALTHESLASAVQSFGSRYCQTPPVYSALKHNGTRLSALARNNTISADALRTIASYKQREVDLFQLQLLAYEAPLFSIHAHVSHGTYIRSLINDIAQKVGSYATTAQLERTHIGPFAVTDAQPLHQYSNIETVMHHLIAPEIFLARLHKKSVSCRAHVLP